MAYTTHMNTINKLTKIFSEFPGIGPRQAKRFVYFLLTRNNGYIENLISLLSDLKKGISVCEECYRFFPNTPNQVKLCDICRSPNRDLTELMIVSRDVDLENIEKSHSFNGHYFVLGGSVPILEKNPEEKIRLNELRTTIQRLSPKGLKEIILGLNANPEGEYTGIFIKQTLESLLKEKNIIVTVLGRGLSTGTELEYSDSDTIKNAFLNRHTE
jgi:recombination protein RecR